MKQKIELTKEIKIILIQALKNGQVDAATGQQIADYFSVLNPFQQMRLNHNIESTNNLTQVL